MVWHRRGLEDPGTAGVGQFEKPCSLCHSSCHMCYPSSRDELASDVDVLLRQYLSNRFGRTDVTVTTAWDTTSLWKSGDNTSYISYIFSRYTHIYIYVYGSQRNVCLGVTVGKVIDFGCSGLWGKVIDLGCIWLLYVHIHIHIHIYIYMSWVTKECLLECDCGESD